MSSSIYLLKSFIVVEEIRFNNNNYDKTGKNLR